MAASTSAAAARLCSANVSYKKKPGQLVLTRATIAWTATGSSVAEFEVANKRMSTLFSSKEGGPKVMLRLGILPSSSSAPQIEENHNFTFTEASSNISDREKFKVELSAVIAQNKSADVAPTPGGSSSAGRGTGTPAPGTPTPGTPSNAPPSGAAATSSTTSAPSLNDLRRTLLTRHPSLESLHKSLVRTKLLTEAEFWAGREDLLSSLSSEFAQKKGKAAEMIDPKVESGDNGSVKVKITTNMIREIFEEYPSVLRAYNDNVPDPLDETTFWTRYFQSKLFNRNRTTNRAAVNTIKDDGIFDQYLGEEDDELEPKNLKEHDIYRLLDLRATEEDQHEVSNQKDYTMRAGGQRASLPLMRRFNEHSSRLLTQSLGPQSTHHSATSLAPGNAGERNKSYYNDIILDDLNTLSAEDRIELKFADGAGGDKRFGVVSEEGENGRLMEDDEARDVTREMKERFEDWEAGLGEFEMDDEAVNESVKKMMESMRMKTDRSSHSSLSHGGLPDSLLRQLTTLQSSSNELLRQFWLAILPQSSSDLSSYSPAQKAAKAEKMLGYIKKSEGRCEELVGGLEVGEVRTRVEFALKPVREAMGRAVEEFEKRIQG